MLYQHTNLSDNVCPLYYRGYQKVRYMYSAPFTGVTEAREHLLQDDYPALLRHLTRLLKTNRQSFTETVLYCEEYLLKNTADLAITPLVPKDCAPSPHWDPPCEADLIYYEPDLYPTDNGLKWQHVFFEASRYPRSAKRLSEQYWALHHIFIPVCFKIFTTSQITAAYQEDEVREIYKKMQVWHGLKKEKEIAEEHHKILKKIDTWTPKDPSAYFFMRLV